VRSPRHPAGDQRHGPVADANDGPIPSVAPGDREPGHRGNGATALVQHGPEEVIRVGVQATVVVLRDMTCIERDVV